MPGDIKLWKHPVTGRYYITWTVGRRSVRRSTRTGDRGEAERVRAAFVLGLDRPAELDPAELKVETALDSYYERHARHLPSAIQAAIAIRSLKTFYGDAAVSLVNARSNERYIESCRREGLSPATINQRLTRLRAALRLAVKSGDLKSAPHVPSLAESAPRADYLERGQIATLLWAARRRPHVALFIRLAIYTGARASAILQLTWDRVDLRTGTVDFRLPGALHARKRRAITAVPGRLLASLRRWRKVAQTGHVIERDGRALKSIKRAFKLTAAESGLPWATPHVLKHTAATMALRVASPWVVSGMTATSIRTLQRVYGKHMIGDLKKAVEDMARASVARKPRAIRKNTRRMRVKRPDKESR